ncbi:MAG: N-acetylmuramoyl-L-alanine amidase [Bacillota bacterium]
MKIVDVRNLLAKHPAKEYGKRSQTAIRYIAIHHSATQGGDAFSFARYHVNSLDWPGIGYHYVILIDGTIQWTNDLTTASYHVKDYNSRTVGVCLVGNFVDGQLNPSQKEALYQLCRSLLRQLNLNPEDIRGHNEFLPGYTQCPALNMDEIRRDLAVIQEGVIEIYVDGLKIEVTGELRDDVTYVPLRAFSEALGFQVNWDGDNERVYIETK